MISPFLLSFHLFPLLILLLLLSYYSYYHNATILLRKYYYTCLAALLAVITLTHSLGSIMPRVDLLDQQLLATRARSDLGECDRENASSEVDLGVGGCIRGD